MGFLGAYVPQDLFAGKIHALLCRPWQKRIKGRDWYDFVWYIGRNIPVNLQHCRERLIQSNAWNNHEKFTATELKQLLTKKINNTDFNNAKKDILPFINDPQSLSLWSQEFFLSLLGRLKYVQNG